MESTEPETVLVAGASGDTGRAVLRLAGSRLRTVALTRSRAKGPALRAAGADDVVVEDLLDPDDLAGALDGVDAVVSAVGSDLSDLRRDGPFVDGVGVRNLLDAAVDAGVDAFVMESAIGVGDDPASPLAAVFGSVIGPIQRAKGETERALRSAPVRHTIFRPGVLTNGLRTDDVTVAEPGAKLWGTVSRADVARLLVAAPFTEAAADRRFEVVATPGFPDRGLSIDWRLPQRAGDSVPVDVVDDR